MKKTMCVLLIAALSLSIVACGGKKQEPKLTEDEAKLINDVQTALAEAPEVEEEPAGPETFECLDEMYDYKLEDGVFQIDDIIFDSTAQMSMADALSMFESKRNRYTFEFDEGNKWIPYDPETTINSGYDFTVRIKRDGMIMIALIGVNLTDSPQKAPDCTYKVFSFPTKDTEGLQYVWFAGGIHAGGSGINYGDVLTTILADFTEDYVNYHYTYRPPSAMAGTYAPYKAYVTANDPVIYGDKSVDVVYEYEIWFDRSTGNCYKIILNRLW